MKPSVIAAIMGLWLGQLWASPVASVSDIAHDEISLFDDYSLSSHFVSDVQRFYHADEVAVVQPYLALVKQLRAISPEARCSAKSQALRQQAVALNPSSLVAYWGLKQCAQALNNTAALTEYTRYVDGLSAALTVDTSGWSSYYPIQIREIDEAQALLEVYGYRVIDIELLIANDQLVYEYHVYDPEYETANYVYFSNMDFAPIQFAHLLSDDSNVTEQLLSHYLAVGHTPALNYQARELLHECKYQAVIDVLSPVASRSEIAQVLLATASFELHGEIGLNEYLAALENASSKGLLDAHLALAYFSFSQSSSNNHYRDTYTHLDAIDHLSWPGNGAYRLALMFEEKKQDAKALALYEEAVVLENDDAQLKLGYYYDMGLLGLEENDDLAFKLYQLAAEQGNNTALNNLAVFYETGGPVPQDLTQSLEYYEQAIANGYTRAYCHAGEMFEDYPEIRNKQKAFEYYEKGANLGEDKCQFSLGYLYDNTLNNKPQAAYWYEQAAAQGNVSAAANLGEMYRDGKGVNQDNVTAFDYFLFAAQGGSSHAMFEVGIMYQAGTGTQMNEQSANHWLEKAAGQGLAEASFVLGKNLLSGRGVDADEEKGIHLIQQSAERGYSPAVEFIQNHSAVKSAVH